MKRKITLLLVVCLIGIMSGQAFASDYDIMPRFNVVSAVNTSISSEDDGVGMKIWVCAPESTSLDRVNVVVKLKRSSGVTAVTFSQNVEKQGSVFFFNETGNVNVSGTYHFEYTAKCYKNNVLVDTITGTSASVYHSA